MALIWIQTNCKGYQQRQKSPLDLQTYALTPFIDIMDTTGMFESCEAAQSTYVYYKK